MSSKVCIRRSPFLVFPLLFLLTACGSTVHKTTVSRKPGGGQRGNASWYGGKFHGRQTASGEIYNKEEMTAAHRKLPFGTLVRVTNRINGRSVTVRINDRGPYSSGRILDVSEAAARKLGMLDDGVVPVTLKVIRRPRR
jgi:rare lipoprotein A